MAYRIPNGGNFQHAATYAPALAFTAITNASEAVATVADADLAAGDIVLLIQQGPASTSRPTRPLASIEWTNLNVGT